jgi:transposase-like protein
LGFSEDKVSKEVSPKADLQSCLPHTMGQSLAKVRKRDQEAKASDMRRVVHQRGKRRVPGLL